MAYKLRYADIIDTHTKLVRTISPSNFYQKANNQNQKSFVLLFMVESFGWEILLQTNDQKLVSIYCLDKLSTAQ